MVCYNEAGIKMASDFSTITLAINASGKMPQKF